jgi:hypothetical protein
MEEVLTELTEFLINEMANYLRRLLPSVFAI